MHYVYALVCQGMPFSEVLASYRKVISRKMQDYNQRFVKCSTWTAMRLVGWLVGWLVGTSPNSVFRDFFSDFSGIFGSKNESTIQGATFYRGVLSCLPRFPGPAKLHSSCLIDPHPVASFFDERTTSK